MTESNNNDQPLPIQLLITACPTTCEQEHGYAWLHGYCLLSYQEVNGAVHLNGQVRIGNRYTEDPAVLSDLAQALNPRARLAGLDLTDTISRVSRLAIDAENQQPALTLLLRLKAMLEEVPPIELALNEEGLTELVAQIRLRELGTCDVLEGRAELKLVARGLTLLNNRDNGNPHRLAVELADTAGACILSAGELYLAENLRPKLSAAWQHWRRTLKPKLSN
jgi:hypothetical protein